MGSGFSMIFKRKLEETVPFTILYCIAILFLSGVLGSLIYGLGILVAGTCGIWLWILAKKKFQWEYIITPGLIFFMALFLLAVCSHRYQIVTEWDEIAQWALSPKNMYLLNQIPTGANSNIIYTDYPPASALWEYFWCKMTGQFQDSSLYIAHTFWTVGLLAPVYAKYSWKQWKKGLLIGLLLLTAPCAFYQYCTWTGIYIDYLLGALAAYGFYGYYAGKKETFDWLNIGLSIFVVLQVKSTGMFFAVLILWFVLWDMLHSNKQSKKKEAVIAAGLLVSLCASRLLWTYFLNKNDMGTFWSYDNMTLAQLNVFSTTNGVEGWHRTAFANCFRAIFNINISTRAIFYVRGIQVPLIVWYIIVAVVSWIAFLAGKKNGTLFRAYVVWIVANIVFTISVAYIYYLQMTEAECTVLAAYGRYMSTVLSGIWLFGILILSDHLGQISWKKYYMVGILALLLFPKWSVTDFIIPSSQIEARKQAYTERQQLTNQAEKLKEYIADGSTIVFNGKTYEYNYILAPVKFSGPFGTAVYTDLEQFARTVPYNKYVYFGNQVEGIYTEEFKENNRQYFWGDQDNMDMIQPYSLYRVQYGADGQVVFEWITTLEQN
jgi:hypothetical protein